MNQTNYWKSAIILIAIIFTGALQGSTFKISHAEQLTDDVDTHMSTEGPVDSNYNLFIAGSSRNAASEVSQVEIGTLLEIDLSVLSNLRSSAPQSFAIEIPRNQESNLIMDLTQVDVFSDGFTLNTDIPVTAENREELQDMYNSIDLGIHYKGTVQGAQSSLVAFSVYQDHVAAIIGIDGEDYEFGKLLDSDRDYILYKVADLSPSAKEALGMFQCETSQLEQEITDYTEEELNYANRAPGDITEVYLVGSNSYYIDNGSSLATSITRLTTAFAQTVIAYSNESIAVESSGVFIWTTPEPFDANLEPFKDYYNGAGAGWPGNLAHFIRGNGPGSGAGGVAYVNVLCGSSFNYGLTSPGASAPIENIPSYSRFVKVLTHEIGHNFGSRHTQACVWNGNNTQIDDYGNTDAGAGGAAATHGGNDGVGLCYTVQPPATNPLLAVTPTIMSYYDSRGYGAFSLGNGFGTQPGNVIRNSVANATCLQCPVTTIYLPNDTTEGPALILCSTETPPDGYYIANQSCAQSVIDNDPFCLENTWDGLCKDAYNSCLYGCENPIIVIPITPTALNNPALFTCDNVPDGYVAALSQQCALLITQSDEYCINNSWDNTCYFNYFECGVSQCSNGLQDNDEEGVDCGGTFCSPCPTCDDGIQNGNETGVDCGGPDCPACPTCDDGIQNGNETGVDCGGPDCPACPTCDDGIQNGNETGVDCGGPDCPACPTCDDGIQNGNETGVDCGGPDCAACPTCDDGIQNGNETGVDCGGPDCVPCATPPTNDDCDGAENVPVITDGQVVTIVGDATGATIDIPDILGQPLVWEAFTLSTCSDLSLSLCSEEELSNGFVILTQDCPQTEENFLFASTADLDGAGCLQLIFEGLEPGTYYFPIASNWVFGEYSVQLSAISCPGCDPGSAPVDLTKSFDPVNGVRDRVQVKWYKASPQVKYTDEDAVACDIKFWPKRDLDPVTGNPIGMAYVNPDTTNIVDAKKFLADGISPRSIFKWPVKFRADGVNNSKRALPNLRYEWKVRCACDHGLGAETPWSAIKIFNTPDFNPATGIYNGPIAPQEQSNGFKKQEAEQELTLFPNPAQEILSVRLAEPMEGMVTVMITDPSGRTIMEIEESLKGNTLGPIDIEQLPVGIYQMTVIGERLNTAKSFVIAR